MYLYFDSGGILKEIINDKPLRQNSSGWNTIFCYFENNTSGLTNLNGTIRYILSDGNDYVVGGTHWISADAYTMEQIPFNQYRDLTHFKYYEDYRMFKFVVPDNVLAISGVLGICIRILDADGHVISMQRVACMVEPTTNAGSVYSGEDCIGIDTTISVAEYNDLYRQLNSLATDIENVEELFECTYGSTTLAQIGNAISSKKVPVCHYYDKLYVYSATNIEVSPPSTEIVFTRVEGNVIYELKVNTSNTWSSSSKTLQEELNSGVNIKTINSIAVVGSGNIPPKDLLPSITGNAKKVLKVNAGGNNVEWGDESNIIVFDSSLSIATIKTDLNNGYNAISSDGTDIKQQILNGDYDSLVENGSFATTISTFVSVGFGYIVQLKDTTYTFFPSADFPIGTMLVNVKEGYPDWAYTSSHVFRAIEGYVGNKQDSLVGGVNIKNVNGNNLVGSGNIPPKDLLPSLIGNAGKVLKVNSTETDVEWATDSGGGGGSGGTQLYVHTVTATTGLDTATFKVYSADADAYTVDTLRGKLTTALQITTNKTDWGTVFCVYDYGLYNIYMVQSSISILIGLVDLRSVSDSVVAL